MTKPFLQEARILIVDDKESNVLLLADFLTESGYHHYASVTDSRLVVELVKTFKPDLILLDLMMPHLDGFEIMDQLNKLIPSNEFLPILVLTANISVEMKLKALSSGARDFLSKPYDLHEVRLRIENLLEIRYLHQQLNNQNQILQDKVEERTKELKLMNLDLTIARDLAQQSDRLKTSFLNNISHEIRTPLNAILGFAPFILQPDISQKEKEDFLSYLDISGNRLLNTITDIIDMSLILTGNMPFIFKPVIISNLLESVFKDFQELASRKKLVFNMQLPDNANRFIINTDEELLRKAISKLVDNSIKFTAVGNITLGFDFIKNKGGIFVKDTGDGIEDDVKEIIFEYFMQGDVSNTRGFEGSGLGLSIAKGVMQLLGGEIRIESVKNVGTTVHLELPSFIST
jgi:signal transduction histidine kinase